MLSFIKYLKHIQKNQLSANFKLTFKFDKKVFVAFIATKKKLSFEVSTINNVKIAL